MYLVPFNFPIYDDQLLNLVLPLLGCQRSYSDEAGTYRKDPVCFTDIRSSSSTGPGRLIVPSEGKMDSLAVHRIPIAKSELQFLTGYLWQRTSGTMQCKDHHAKA
jgi:hypothetical protein